MDLAEVHITCLEKLVSSNDDSFFKVYNVGTGKGTSVLELIHIFENVNDIKSFFRHECFCLRPISFRKNNYQFRRQKSGVYSGLLKNS